MLAGLLTIALLASLYLGEPRRWVRLFGAGLFAGVIAQGVLGGMRVLLDERILALIHGCTGPLFFAATVGMVAVTSAAWNNVAAIKTPPTKGARLLRLSILTASLAYLQLVVGAVVRHSPLMLAEGADRVFQIAVYFHVLLALAVTVHVLLLAHKCYWSGLCRGASVTLALLIGLQLLLGVSSWIVKYGLPAWATGVIGETGHFNRAEGAATAAIVTAHGAVGALILALCVMLALRVGRAAGISSRLSEVPNKPVSRALA
jgi:cytochrome c oxidase assembly protein subunit 15